MHIKFSSHLWGNDIINSDPLFVLSVWVFSSWSSIYFDDIRAENGDSWVPGLFLTLNFNDCSELTVWIPTIHCSGSHLLLSKSRNSIRLVSKCVQFENFYCRIEPSWHVFHLKLKLQIQIFFFQSLKIFWFSEFHKFAQLKYHVWK